MKAIVTDLDRTLLHTDKTLSAYSAEMLNLCRERGLRVIASSARPLRDIVPFEEQIAFDAVIASNGAVVRLPDRLLQFGVDRRTGEGVIEALMAFPDVLLSVETSGGLFANRDIPVWQPVVYHDFPRLPRDIILYKILASSPDQQLYREIASLLPDDVYHTLAGTELLQIMSRTATKWHGVCEALTFFGISPEETVCFGDDNDDAESLRRCGMGVAVGNAIPAVLQAADYVAASNDEDGVARFIATSILHNTDP